MDVEPTIHQLRIAIKGGRPAIWRRVAVRSSVTLGELHEIIRIAMGWGKVRKHLFIFENPNPVPDVKEMLRLATEQRWDEHWAALARVRNFGPRARRKPNAPDLAEEDENKITLGELCPNEKMNLYYEFDLMKKEWIHTIEVQKVTPPKAGVTYPICLAGRMACPIAECSDIHEYLELLDILKNPLHVDHKRAWAWLQEDDFDPEAFDVDRVNARLAEWSEARKPKLRLRRR